MPFERYRRIIPDWDGFLATARRPEPTTIRVRSGRIAPADLVQRLERVGFRLVPLDGQPDFFRVDHEPVPVSLTPEHWLGLFYQQRASTGLAAPVLGPAPGERVLDMCAAPGGKTTHLADLMQDRGPLVAVEPNEARIRALAGNVYRTAHVNVLTVAADGRFLPGGARFDRVLVDAPCSAEGTVRAGRGRVRSRSEGFLDYITRLQESLLRRAIDLVRPGGTVLYSTCTFAPEENEAVVDAVLRDMPVALLPIGLEVPFEPGLTGFEGTRYDPTLGRTARIYPHHLDSGGLFLALLRREGPSGPRVADGPDSGWTPIPLSFPDADRRDAGRDAARLEAIRTSLAEPWKVDPGALESIGWLMRNDRAWVHGSMEWPFDAWEGHRGWTSISVGLRAFGFDSGDLPRPTNDLLRWLGDAIAGRRVELSDDAWRRLLARQPVTVRGIEDGYAAMLLDGLPAGRGFVRSGRVRHEIPGVHARSLARVLGTDPAGEGQSEA